ncbi:MAG TPA: hypothetical protein VGV88_10315 [Candidatus Dormibacteraeota bacterium]|nr:hypothetical protein [Candidatus Dormibacteraeota bacterium]
MEIRNNPVRFSTRSLVLIVALFCALAIGLTGVYTLRSTSGPAVAPTVTKSFAFDHEVPGPDSQSYKAIPVHAVDSADPIGK